MTQVEIKERLQVLRKKREELKNIYDSLSPGQGYSEDVDQNEIDERFLNKEKIIRNDNYVITGSGQYFSKEKVGFLPELMNTIYNGRKIIKHEMIELEKQYEVKASEKLTEDISRLNNEQLALKILINAVYGATASPHFRYYDIRMAKAITISGQLALKWLAPRLQTYLETKFGAKKDCWVYGDTDSVAGNTMIKTSRGDIKIEDLFNIIDGDMIVDDILNKNYVKQNNTDIKAYGVNSDKELVLEDIRYIMKHKVKKVMYKIKIKGKDVSVTADHSIMILRDDILISVKPTEIKKGDMIAYIC